MKLVLLLGKFGAAKTYVKITSQICLQPEKETES